MRNIILVGFMGTGKSAVGRSLARRLKRPFVDLDRWMEKKAARSIAQIFSENGEAGFRKLEQEAVKEVILKSGQVIAAGGGVLLNEENVKRLKGSGVLVCLTASPEVILKRTLASLPSRPLLKGPQPRERIEELLALRAPSYAQAHKAIDTSGLRVEEVVEEVLRKIADCGLLNQ